MNDLERIDDYFSGRLPVEERARFETSLETNSALAEAVAFYLTARQAAQTEARAHRQARFEMLREESGPVRQWPSRNWLAMAASAVLILGLGGYWLFQRQTPSATELADQYIQQNFSQLSTQMNGQTDSLQTGIARYNEGKIPEAGAVFNDLLQRNPADDRARKLAGLVALRTGQYNQAIDHFHRLSERTDLYANPGLFLEALTRLKRGQPDDLRQAETLLKTVIDQNLEGKAEAEVLLEKL
jgi:tetratricopeptide (TPR) repeat protein